MPGEYKNARDARRDRDRGAAAPIRPISARQPGWRMDSDSAPLHDQRVDGLLVDLEPRIRADARDLRVAGLVDVSSLRISSMIFAFTSSNGRLRPPCGPRGG